MDESGFAIGDVEASQRIINTEIRQKFQAKPGRQEWVTAVECICVDGSFVPPLIIFKGEKLSRQWVPASIHNNWRFGCIPKDGLAMNTEYSGFVVVLSQQLERKRMENRVY